LFRSIIEIDPRTAVPKESPSTPDRLETDGRGGPVLCVLSSCAAPLVPEVTSQLKPHYDSARRELSLDGVVLKRFKRPAENQEAILKAFEEESEQNDGLWPPKIDDPISGESPDPIKRLHNALDALNKAIAEGAGDVAAPHCLEFFTDGTGQAVRWRVVAVTR
jgi:hypothetical protein